MILSHVPVIDLIVHGIQAPGSDLLTTGGFLYDVGQAVAGLHALARGAVWVSEKTPTERDDPWAKKFLGHTTSAMEWVARFGGALQKESATVTSMRVSGSV